MDRLPLQADLLAPRRERLEQLAQEIYDKTWESLCSDDRSTVYLLALQEMQVSALSVVAQFCVRMSGG